MRLHQTSTLKFTYDHNFLPLQIPTLKETLSSSMSSETNTVWEEVHGPGGVGITNGRKWSPPTTHADVLHPLATIQWETCWKLEGTYSDCIDTVVLDDKLYLGVTYLNANGLWAGMVIEFSSDLAAWKMLPLPPAIYFGLSTYHSQLVLVGGRLTNKLWVFDNYAWHCSLPPMRTGREYPVVVNTGTPEYLVVAGSDHCVEPIEGVEVLIEGQWVSCAPLYSKPRCGGIHNGNLYFSFEWSPVVYCQLESLVKACVQPDGVSDIGELWNRLPVPEHIIGMVAYGKFLVCLTSSDDLHALSPDTESWVHVGRLDTGRLGRLSTLRTGELVGLTQGYKSLHVKLFSVKGMCPWQVFKLDLHPGTLQLVM